MPKAKHAPMSAKALSQRLKWRGLQKLKFYCQLCEKQMRDDNGFKCHMMSEAHQRNLLIAADDPGKYISHYSELFHRDFMALLKRRWGTTRVHCNVVYCEYVAHKEHYHMNATKWTTLTSYVNWLGEEGICKIDFQDDGTNRGGWYLEYIDNDPELERRKMEIERLAKKQKDMDERHNHKIQEMVDANSARKDALDFAEANKPKPEALDIDGHAKINLSIQTSKKALQRKYEDGVTKDGGLGFKSLVAMTAFSSAGTKEEKATLKPGVKRAKPMSALEEIKLQNEAYKQSQEARKKTAGSHASASLHTVDGEGLTVKQPKTEDSGSRKAEAPQVIEAPEEDPWLTEGIAVKVVTKDLGPSFHKAKGKVIEVKKDNNFEGIVQMIKTGAKVKFDQSHLETVIPAINRDIIVLQHGRYRGRKGVLKSIETESGSVSVELERTQTHKAKFLTGLRYDQISKYLA